MKLGETGVAVVGHEVVEHVVPRCVIRIGLPRGKRDAEIVERVSCVARGVSDEHPTEPTVRSRMLAAPISLWATGVGAALRGRRQYREKYAASWRSAPATA